MVIGKPPSSLFFLLRMWIFLVRELGLVSDSRRYGPQVSGISESSCARRSRSWYLWQLSKPDLPTSKAPLYIVPPKQL